MRGRKPKPTYLRALDGGAARRPLDRADEPRPAGDLFDPPPELSPRQQAIWRHAIAHAPPGMLTKLDQSVFLSWVVAVDTLELARQKVTELGLLVKTRDGNTMQNPYLSIQNKQAAIVMKAAAELGFSPTARTRVKVPKQAPRDNPFGELRTLDD